MPQVHRLALALLTAIASAEDWTRFRGPNGSGIAGNSEFPVEFDATRNMLWRTPVRPGKSSPVLTKRHVFLTSFDQGKLFTSCYDRESGKLLWERSEERRHTDMANLLNHPAAISPVTDGENVYSFFKDYGLVSYDAKGKLRWKSPLGPFFSVMGLGASPIIAGDKVVVVADQVDGLSFIAAFDRNSGEMRWKADRDEGEAWGSPLLFTPAGRSPLILTASRGQLGAHHPGTGNRVLSHHGIATTIVASPILEKDTLFVFGYGSDTPVPFGDRLSRLDKNQDGQLSPEEYKTDAFLHGIGKFVGNRDLIVTKEEWDAKQREVMGPNRLIALRVNADASAVSELWRYDRNFTGVIPSPLLYDGVLYVVRNGGILTAFDSQTGKLLRTERIEGALGGYSSSPVAADGKIYLISEEGKVSVLKAGADWSVLATNVLGEACYATPALSKGRIFLRTNDALYAFGSAVESR